MRAQRRDVDVETVRDLVREALDVDLADVPVEDPAFLHADRRTDDVHRNRGADLLVHQHADEVDVDHLARERVDLDVLDHRVALLVRARHLQQEDGPQAVLALLNQFRDRLAIDGNLGGIAVTAVNDRGDLPARPQLPRDALARVVAILDFQCDLSHRVAP